MKMSRPAHRQPAHSSETNASTHLMNIFSLEEMGTLCVQIYIPNGVVVTRIHHQVSFAQAKHSNIHKTLWSAAALGCGECSAGEQVIFSGLSGGSTIETIALVMNLCHVHQSLLALTRQEPLLSTSLHRHLSRHIYL